MSDAYPDLATTPEQEPAPPPQVPAKRRFPRWGWPLLAAIAIGVTGFASGVWFSWDEPPTEGPVRVDTDEFRFISPLLGCNFDQHYDDQAEAIVPRDRLNAMIDDAEQEGRADDVAIYFLDLKNSSAFGMNEQEAFFPASLLKVPVMIYFLKQAEDDPTILDQPVVFTGHDTELADQHFPPQERVTEGTTYTVADLIRRAIIFSDNDAANALIQLATEDNLKKMFLSLRTERPPDQPTDFMSAEDYATFFRVLYNASYLSDTYSEQALDLLTRATFDQGLTALLPPNIPVANKFGESRGGADNPDQLHDCGIIYVPEKPYLLCVMTRGENLDTLATVIADISKTVYDEVTAEDGT